ncbi:helix-turn-helix domain-containing protein [Sabulicella rubraurantiaca]|uniref:helix-turn-helix domain-containing protein n=1 Tax=Sabulicella rubraurantiaca TaxID=2811429 RepID=UPI001A960B52|nr:helix-turn-helix domain-containing protein [Sabulicella rubraurantiaca]
MQDARARIGKFDEVEEFVSALRTLEASVVALPAEGFGASVATIRLDELAVEVVRTRPVLLMAATAEERSGCLVTLDGAQGTRWNGLAVGYEDVAVLAPGSTLAADCRDDCAYAFVSADPAHPSGAAALGVEDEPPPRRGAVRVARANASAHRNFAAIVRHLEEIATSGPSLLVQHEPRRALRDELASAARGLLFPCNPAPARRRATTRHLVVRRAEEHLCACPSRPIYTDELCEALGVSASALHEAFHATFGVSPHRYLKMRRLGMVRAMLLAHDAPWRSVKAVALSHGFWHLGQFSHDYRANYGESPSDTLARAR